MTTFFKFLLLIAAILTGGIAVYDFYLVFARPMPYELAILLLVLGSANAALSWWNVKNFRSIK